MSDVKSTPKNKDRIMRIGMGGGFMILALVTLGFVLDEQKYDAVWIGMTCDGMIDWSGTSDHHNMQNAGHNAFHKYYADECNGMIEMAMINKTMTSFDHVNNMTYDEFQADLAEMRKEIHEETLIVQDMVNNNTTSISITETLGLTDSVTATSSNSISLTDTLGMADSVTVNMTK